MALVTEDGTGLANAESYISVTDADAYFSVRGNATWAAIATTAAKEQALRKATDYMEAMYGTRWRGARIGSTQRLSWPRVGVYVYGFAVESDIVPTVVGYACAELALRASADELLADGTPQIKSETVGPISVVYADGARQNTAFYAVEATLAAYMQAGGAIPVVRA